jgi:hypothetical protein
MNVFSDSNGHVKELVLPKSLDLDRPKRARTTFSTSQLRQLEIEFQRNQYLVGAERAQLAVQLGLTETQVRCGQKQIIIQNHLLPYRLKVHKFVKRRADVCVLLKFQNFKLLNCPSATIQITQTAIFVSIFFSDRHNFLPLEFKFMNVTKGFAV